jgi:hypothetical protein
MKQVLLLASLWLLSGCTMVFPSSNYPLELKIEGSNAYSLNSLFDNRNLWRMDKSFQWQDYKVYLIKTETSPEDVNVKQFHVHAYSDTYDVSFSKSPVGIGEYVNMRVENKRFGPGQIPSTSERSIRIHFNTADGSLGVSRTFLVHDLSLR